MADPFVGGLFPPDKEYPAAKQPGGPGTIVTDPIQSDGEKIGLFVAGCGHFFNSWMIQKIAVSGTASAVIGCPVCGYCQRIITPYDLINDNQVNPIIIA
jgi:hypothetical protein